MKTTGRYVALLRGVNVGGKNKLPMKELAELFAATGCGEVQTYIQSGNVVFQAPESLAKLVPERVTREIEQQFGFRAPILVRSSGEIAAVAARNPFLEADTDVTKLMVVFLAQMPDVKLAAQLDPRRSPPDEFALRGREIYLRCPNGFGRTKFNNDYFEAKLDMPCTVRNWRTVLKLTELSNISSTA